MTKQCIKPFIAMTVTIAVLFGVMSPLSGAEARVEASLSAEAVQPGAVLLSYTAVSETVVSGFSIWLTNCLPPAEPVTVVLSAADREQGAPLTMPALQRPLYCYCRPHTHDPSGFPPYDIARVWCHALDDPITLQKGESVQLVVKATGTMRSGLSGALQIQGEHKLADMERPFRDCRTNGPVCRIPWEKSQTIAVGTQKKFDPLCAPQNNSSVIADDDGTLWQFTAYYSVDEQYGGGRGGSYSRIFAYKKSPHSEVWELHGLVADVLDGSTYSGDPFVFRDLSGTPCLVFTTCDGTDGFADWQFNDTRLMRSKTKSFAGPWNEPTMLFEKYPREPDDNKTGGRANCVRIYSRPKTNDYVFCWNHGTGNMDIRAIIIPDLDTLITHEQINNGSIVAENQEEGGGGFQCGDKGYYSTWQIPWLNDPNGQQRLYEFDLADATNPEAWHVVPGSFGFNDGTDATRDGGCTADAWAISAVRDELWASACEYSVTENKNYLTARCVKRKEGEVIPRSDVFRYGAVRTRLYHETAPVVEYAVGKICSLEYDFRSWGDEAWAIIGLGPSDLPLLNGSLFFEMSPTGCRFVATDADGGQTQLVKAEENAPRWSSDKTFHIKLTRYENEFIAFVDGKEVLRTTISDAKVLEQINKNPRFKFYGWQGSLYEISSAILTDGQ
ncbi:MAG: hypothetical protein Q4G68_02615 [Planctomycetia bacterium]|nr:hypothetical protein [Planctomycetia bacterium]